MHHSLCRLHLTALLGVLSFIPLFSVQAQTASVRGIVTAANDGATLVGANVIVSTPDGDRAGATATNVDGFYEIRGLDPGTYQIEITYVGYETHVDTLNLTDGRREYSVRLSISEQRLEGVRVEAERGAAHRRGGRQRVGTADVGRIPTPGPSGDLAAYLQTLPGVISVGDRGGGLYIRGGTPSHNLTLVDGLRIMKPLHISSLYSAFPEKIIKNVDVHAGGFGAQYMGALSSVLDVSLRKGNMEDNEASVSTSPFLTSVHLEGPITEGKTSFLGHARYSIIEETAPSLYGRAVPFAFYDLTARYSVQTESGTSCNFTGMRTHDRGRINADRNLVLSWTNATIGGRCLFFGEGLPHPIEVSAGYTYFDNQAGSASAPQRSASLHKSYIDFDSNWDVLGNTLDYGARWVVSNYKFDLDEQFIIPRRSNKVTGALQAHASTNIRVSDRLRMTPSFGTHVTAARIRIPTFEPRFRLSYRPDANERQEINIAAGVYNQVTSGISDERDAGTVFTAWQPAEDDTPLARALHGILGYRHQFGSAVELSVETYAKSLSNLPVPRWSAVARFDTETTLADGHAYGFDIRGEIDVGSTYLFLGYGWSSLTYQASRQSLGAWTGDRVVEYHPAHDRRHQLNAVASLDVAGATLNVNWKLASGRPYTKVSQFDFVLDLEKEYPTSSPGTPYVFYERPYNARLPFYHRLDISIEHSIELSNSISLDSTVGAINTYDRKNIFYYDTHTLQRVDQSPFLPYLSLSVSIE